MTHDSATSPAAHGQHVRVKRLTDTFFVSLDLAAGATAAHLHARTAALMAVPPPDLRLCAVCPDGRTAPLAPDAPLAPGCVVCAVLRLHGEWERPCIVDYPQ